MPNCLICPKRLPQTVIASCCAIGATAAPRTSPSTARDLSMTCGPMIYMNLETGSALCRCTSALDGPLEKVMRVSHRPLGMRCLLAAAALLVGFAQPARAAGIPPNVIIFPGAQDLPFFVATEK